MAKKRKLILFLGDIFLLYLALFLTICLRWLGKGVLSLFVLHLLPFSIIYLFWLVSFYAAGLYDISGVREKISFYSRLSIATTVNLIIGISFFYIFPFFKIAPKITLLLDSFLFSILFLFWRTYLYKLLLSHTLEGIVIIGKGELAERLREKIREKKYLGYKLIEVKAEKDLGEELEKGTIKTIIFQEEEKDILFSKIISSWQGKARFLNLLNAYELIERKIPLKLISESWLLENISAPKDSYEKLKRLMDIILAFAILSLTLPLWPIFALCIKAEDGGPVFYFQERVGKRKKVFTLYKFRSMKVGAEKKKPIWAKKKDKRITRVGKILRRLHLDELPQMINVLKGDISLVGPRPERPEFVAKLEKEIPYYNFRHFIKPGFTGWAQIKFRYSRSVIDSEEKFEYDLYYTKNRSLFLDIGILLKTFQLFFRRE